MPVLRNAQPGHSEDVLTVRKADVSGSGRSTSASGGRAVGRAGNLLEVPKAPAAGKQVLWLLWSAPAGSRPRCGASPTGTACGTDPSHAPATGSKAGRGTAGSQAPGEACTCARES
jgi:hypothetical protein